MGNTGTVTVISPIGRTVYINGNYNPGFPQVIEYSFVVPYGPNVFETRDGNGRVDFRGSVVTNDANTNCKIALSPV